MRYTKPFILLVSFLIPLNNFAQDIDSKLDSILETKFDSYQAYLLLQDTTINPEYILQKAITYLEHPNEKSRFNAYYLLLGALPLSGAEPSESVDFLLKYPCQDKSKRNRMIYGRWLSRFNQTAFNEPNTKLLKQILYNDELVNYCIIQIAGYLDLKEDKKRIEYFLDANNLEHRSINENWVVQLALARMGEQQYIDSVMTYIEPQKSYKQAAFSLAYLSYIQQDEATDIIIEVLMNKSNYNPWGSVYGYDKATLKMLNYGGIDTYSLWAAGVLGLILEDAPIEVTEASITHEELKIIRDWVQNRDKNEPWRYNRDTFWSKKGQRSGIY